MLKRGLLKAMAATALIATGGQAFAAPRIKDIVDVENVRPNQLVGYGLVVGLAGTGDRIRNSPFTEESMQSMLSVRRGSPEGPPFTTRSSSGFPKLRRKVRIRRASLPSMNLVTAPRYTFAMRDGAKLNSKRWKTRGSRPYRWTTAGSRTRMASMPSHRVISRPECWLLFLESLRVIP